MPQHTVDESLRSRIQGWGADLNMSDRPAVPMERTPARFTHPHWEKVEQQPVRMKLFKSIERPNISPVFGTSAPPTGLSGMIRGVAFKFSENDLRHWYMLVLADRINMVEGIFQDLARGHIPNIYKEMGGPAEWRYNRAGFIRKAAVVTGVVGLASYFIVSRMNRRRRLEVEAR